MTPYHNTCPIPAPPYEARPASVVRTASALRGSNRLHYYLGVALLSALLAGALVAQTLDDAGDNAAPTVTAPAPAG